MQPEYATFGDNAEKCKDIIQFVNNQTGPVLMFVNAEDMGLTADTVQDIKDYWDETICPEEDSEYYDEETDEYIANEDCPTINWNRFAIVDKGFGDRKSTRLNSSH